MTRSRFHSEDRQPSGATVQNFVGCLHGDRDLFTPVSTVSVFPSDWIFMKSDIGVSFIEMFALTPNVLDIGQHFHEERFAFLLASRAGG